MIIVITAVILAVVIVIGIIMALMVRKKKKEGKLEETNYRSFASLNVIRIYCCNIITH